jgi:putative oxidoreductase
MHSAVSLIARILLSIIFLSAGYGKITGYAGTEAYMQQHGVPGMLLPAVIALELLGGLAIVFGIGARYAGLALGLFSILAAAIFHHDFGDQMQAMNFMKDLAIAGGLLLLFANGSGAYAVKPD